MLFPFCVFLSGTAYADNCNDGVGGLSDKELAQILPHLDIGKDRELVGFNCRDPRKSERIIVATHIGSNLGDLFLVTFAKNKAKARALERGHFDIIDILKDQGGNAYALVKGNYLHQGPTQTWHLLADFRTGKTIWLADASEDPVTGWCGEASEENEPAAYDTASEMALELETRPDGLKTLRYTITTKDCRTKKITEKTLRYIPGKDGFFPEK